MAQQHSLFNYLDPATWWIATTATERQKTSTIGSVERVGNTVVLSRTSDSAGLVFLLGNLVAGVHYKISGVYGNSNGFAYIGLVSNENPGIGYTSTRKFTISMVDGVVTFTPQETGKYDLLIWKVGTGNITASNVYLTKV